MDSKFTELSNQMSLMQIAQNSQPQPVYGPTPPGEAKIVLLGGVFATLSLIIAWTVLAWLKG